MPGAGDRVPGAGDRLPVSGRVETAGDRVHAEFQNLDFIKSSSIGLLLALVLLGYHINLIGRRFLHQEIKSKGKKIEKTILARNSEEEEAYVIL